MKVSRFSTSIWLIWLIGIHLTIVLLFATEERHRFFSDTLRLNLISKPELSSYYHARRVMLRRRFENRISGGTLFIGDSRIDGLNVAAIKSHAVNLGIGTDTSFGVLQRLMDYAPYEKHSLLFLAIGLNDLRYRDPTEILSNIRKIADSIGHAIPIVIMAVVPVDEEFALGRLWNNSKIHRLNSLLADLATDTSATFFDLNAHLMTRDGGLDAAFHIGDGVHFNKLGNEILIREIRNELMRYANRASRN